MGQVIVKIGDLFCSSAQTLVNTVNCVGVMGKGVALEFKRRFPEMFLDYRYRCERGEVKLGKPYLYRLPTGLQVLNFPTKDHWRAVSRLSDIVAGLEHLRFNYKAWEIKSLAVPPLGCGNGQLDWTVVGPTLYRYLKTLDVPVELFAPRGSPAEQLTFEFLEQQGHTADTASRDREPLRVDPAAVAIVAVVSRISRERVRPPIGRTAFQKIAYFLTVLGVPTGLVYRRGSYGPFSPDLKPILSRLVNNGLVAEHGFNGKFSVEVGPTYRDARERSKERLKEWAPHVEKVADLLLRLQTASDIELAASAIFAARELAVRDRKPTEAEIFRAVLEWKARRRPSIDQGKLANAIRELAMLGWLDVRPSADLPVTGVLAELEEVA